MICISSLYCVLEMKIFFDYFLLNLIIKVQKKKK